MKSIYRNPAAGQVQIRHSIEGVLSVDGYDLAELLHYSDTMEWARFFNNLAKMISEEGNLPMQLEYVTHHKILTDKARSLMSMIGDYAYHNRVAEGGER